MRRLDSACFEPRQCGARAVDVVDAPAAEPGAVRLLLGEEPVAAAANLVVVAALGSKRLERVRGDVGGRLVRDLAEVAERELVEPERLVVDVEGTPAAASRLHPRRPGQPALDALVSAVAAAQRERDDDGVVHVGVEVVVELEGPAAGREVRPAHGPVALDRDLLVDQPVGGLDQRRVFGAEAGVPEREHGEAGVPYRRLAGLGTKAIALVDREALPALDRAAEDLVLEAVSQRGEHEDRPDPGRLDPAPGAVRLLVLPDPALRLLDRDPAQPARRGRSLSAARARADLAQLHVSVPDRAQRTADGERDE